MRASTDVWASTSIDELVHMYELDEIMMRLVHMCYELVEIF